jgi:hypothetical protein
MRQRGAVAATQRRLRVHSVRARVDAARTSEGDAEAVIVYVHDVAMRIDGDRPVEAKRYAPKEGWINLPVADIPADSRRGFLMDTPWAGAWYKTTANLPFPVDAFQQPVPPPLTEAEQRDFNQWLTNRNEWRARQRDRVAESIRRDAERVAARLDFERRESMYALRPTTDTHDSTWMANFSIGRDTDHLLALDAANEHLMRGMEYGYHV